MRSCSSSGFVLRTNASSASAGFGCIFVERSLGNCLKNDSSRTASVGSKVITNMAEKFEVPGSSNWEKYCLLLHHPVLYVEDPCDLIICRREQCNSFFQTVLEHPFHLDDDDEQKVCAAL